MIAAYLGWRSDGAPDSIGFAAPLRTAFGSTIDVTPLSGGFLCAARPARTAANDPAWRTSDGSSGTVLYGWIDNCDEIVAALGLSVPSGDEIDFAALYDMAFARWGDAVDERLIGHYCAITALSGERLRLVRSPWSAPPLHYVHGDGRMMASSVLRVFFNAGHPREIDFEHLADQLVQDHRPLEGVGWYRGITRVPIGTRVILHRDGIARTAYYDPAAFPEIRYARDEDYVEQARALLDEAAGKALRHSRRPGLMLSGGLDSPLVAEALLRQMPPQQKLKTFTFGPDKQWDGVLPDTLMGDERSLVEAFAAMHPRIEASFADPAFGEFDTGLRDILSACDLQTANIANTGKFHGTWQLARQAGCDWLFNAEFGNFTFSNDGRWSYVEQFRTGEWDQLRQTLSRRAGDGRPLWRKWLALSLLPLAPPRLRMTLRSFVHPDRSDPVGMFSALRPAAREAQLKRASARGTKALMADFHYPRSREEWITAAWHSADSGEDLDLGFERLYGVRRRDICAYRPLIEFCVGVPTGQYVRDGTERWLARRMGEGRMPEAQRLNERYGSHNPDWHVRLGRRRKEIAEYLDRLRDHPELGEMLDIDRLQALLEDWPDETPLDPVEALPRSFALTRALTAAGFVGYAEGRNDI